MALISDIEGCNHSLPALREILDSEKCFRFLKDFRNDTVKEVSYVGQAELPERLASMCLAFREVMP